MAFWNRKRDKFAWEVVDHEPEGMVADRLEEDPGEPQTEGVWNGPVCFGSDGWFHPIRADEHGNEIGPDLDYKLIHNTKAERYEFALPEHRAHKEFWELQHPTGVEKELSPGEQAA